MISIQAYVPRQVDRIHYPQSGVAIGTADLVKNSEGVIRGSAVTASRICYANTSLATLRSAWQHQKRGIAFAIRNGMWQRAAC